MANEFEFSIVYPKDSPNEMAQVKAMLAFSQLEVDSHIEVFVTCREHGHLVACAGLDHNIIKCVAVAQHLRGDSLSLRLGTEIVRLATERGYFHLFLYSAPHNVPFFRGWGFYPLAEVPHLIALMENSPVALKRYCDTLCLQRKPGKTIGSIIMNANPFTLGHRYLVESAAQQCDWLHLFVVKEDASYFSYRDRFALVAEGSKDLRNVTLHEGSDYIISRATFPGYFLKDKESVDISWAAIDLLLFRGYIAPALGITYRFVGTEPFDPVTNKYNAEMKYWLHDASYAAAPITVVEAPRATVAGVPISASEVRRRLAQQEFEKLGELVPPTTFHYLETKFRKSVAVNG